MEPAPPPPTDPPSPGAAPPAAQTAMFGRLELAEVGDYWTDESRDFTPWLAEQENLALLSDTLGISLELLGIEQGVGPFAADIVAKDGDNTVIIEDQLDPTDHEHLAQLLVHAAGRNADTVVWVAQQVTDEHREVIDWLNDQTSIDFWAMEIELWRIGDSAVAPKFSVVCQPRAPAEPPLGEPGEPAAGGGESPSKKRTGKGSTSDVQVAPFV